MLKNYLTIALRNIIKHKTHYALNVLGLAVGMACVMLIALFVLEEFGYNKQPEHAHRLYRVIRETHSPDVKTVYSEGTSGALAVALRQNYPEVQHVVRSVRRDTWIGDQNTMSKQVLCIADENIFDVFGFDLIQGTPQDLYQNASSIMLTENMATKYFGNTDPIGKILRVESTMFGSDYRDYTIVGILKNIQKSTLYFDFLISPTSIVQYYRYWENWSETGYMPIETYLQLHEGHDDKQFERKMQSLIATHMGEEIAKRNTYHLQPYGRIQPFSKQDYGFVTQNYGASGKAYGDMTYIYGAATIAAFVLLIACINFMNLTAAHATNRAKEMGIRKVIGAHRSQLIYQLLSESVLLSLLAFFIAILFVHISLPTFGQFIEKNLTLEIINAPTLTFLCFALIVGLFVGTYPASLLSNLHLGDALKSKSYVRSQNRSRFQKSLVIFQFSLAIILIVTTLNVYAQLNYIQNKNLGYNKDTVLTLPIFHTAREMTTWGRYGMDLKRKYNTVKQAFLKHPNITKATISRWDFGGYTAQQRFEAEGTGNTAWSMLLKAVDEDFLNFYDIHLIAGRGYTPEFAGMTAGDRRRKGIAEEFILNETAVQMLGWTNPIGKTFGWQGDRKGKVIGVVSDFHFQSLHTKIEPMVMVAQIRNMKFLHLKINSQNIPETLAFAEQTWKQFLPTRPFAFSFLDDNLNHFYKAEQKLAHIFTAFSALAIFVACMGLFSLTAFITEQRTKEIGVRKVLGASITNIMVLLTRNFITLVIIANLLAWPLAYITLNSWLQNFAYRITLDLWPFVLGGFLVIFTALLTVGYQSFKAAQTNPIDTLRYE